MDPDRRPDDKRTDGRLTDGGPGDGEPTDRRLPGGPCLDGRRFELVIFDNDGVVVDSEPLAALAVHETLAGLGHEMSVEEIEGQLKGGTLERDREMLEGRFGPLPAGYEDAYAERLFQLMTERLRPVAGIEAVLGELDAAGQAYCIASSARRRRVRFALETAGLAGRFEGRYWGAEDAPRGKPAPDLFLVAASSMHADPSRCVVVEDSWLGVEAARAAGMAVLGFAARTPAGRLADADVVFKDMADLPALLLDHRSGSRGAPPRAPAGQNR